MVALVITANNKMSMADYDAPDYGVIHKAVGGWYERVCPAGLDPAYCMMVNEEGLIHGLPMNLLGSYLYGTYQHGQPIVGDVVILKNGYYGGEPDVVGMTVEEARQLGNQFIALLGGNIRWEKTERSSSHD